MATLSQFVVLKGDRADPRIPPLQTDVSALQSQAATYTGSGDPNGIVTGKVGDGFRQIDAGVFVREWIKTSGIGNTGWE
jgi:hypothetical protein